MHGRIALAFVEVLVGYSERTVWVVKGGDYLQKWCMLASSSSERFDTLTEGKGLGWHQFHRIGTIHDGFGNVILKLSDSFLGFFAGIWFGW